MRNILIIVLMFFIVSAHVTVSEHNLVTKTIRIADGAELLQLQIDYSKGCKISQVIVNGRNTISPSGVFTSIMTETKQYTSLDSKEQAEVLVKGNTIEISNIIFGDEEMSVTETWIFTLSNKQILWNIKREYNQSGKLDKMAIPAWNFSHLSTWKGGILNTGGMVWCKYLKNIDDTYGVHTNGVTFWEPESGDGFKVEASSETGERIASAFSHGLDSTFVFTQYLTPRNSDNATI